MLHSWRYLGWDAPTIATMTTIIFIGYMFFRYGERLQNKSWEMPVKKLEVYEQDGQIDNNP